MGTISDKNKAKDPEKLSDKDHFNDFKNFMLSNKRGFFTDLAMLKAIQASFKVYYHFDQMETTYMLKKDLAKFGSDIGEQPEGLKSMVAVFPDFRIYNEIDFEKLLCRRFRLLHDIDVKTGCPDKRLSPNPEGADFRFSMSGKSFYAIGMHPQSSKISRRSPLPTMIFNLHHHQEGVKENNLFVEAINKIRQRDYMMQDCVNL